MSDTKTYGLTTTGGVVDLPGTVAVTDGGTGSTSQADAQASILPTQTGNGGKFLKTDGAGAVTWDTPVAGSSIVLGYILPDVIGSLPAGINRSLYSGDLLELAPTTIFSTTIADAKANPRTGWTIKNPTNFSAIDANVTTANRLHLVGTASGSYDWWSGAGTAPLLHKLISYNDDYSCIARIHCLQASDTSTGMAFIVADPTDVASMVRTDIYRNGYGVGSQVDTSSFTNITAADDQAEWVWAWKNGSNIGLAVSVDAVTTPPTSPSSWVKIAENNIVFATATRRINGAIAFGFSLFRGSGTGTPTGEVSYFKDYYSSMYPGNRGISIPGDSAAGFAASTDVTLVASVDLTASGTTISNTDIQNALVNATNTRYRDLGTVTYSAVRGGSPSPAASTYQAAGSVTVSGTGRYFALYARLASDGTQTASINLSKIRIPITY